LKTIAEIYFLLGSYVDWRKIFGQVRITRSHIKVKVIFGRV